MPAPQPPFLLVDNKFDRINLYPAAVLSSSGSAPGTDVRYVADYRRDRTLWKGASAAAGQGVQIDSGANSTADTLFVDRGHNAWGKTIRVFAYGAGFVGLVYTKSFTVPALNGDGSYPVGGDPTTATLCATEEGALYGFFASQTVQCWVVDVQEATTPIFTGIILGQRLQLASYATKLDEDAGKRSQRTEESPAGYVASDRTYSWRTLELPLAQIGATAYDAQIRLLRRLCFERNQPAFICMNYGLHPERAWLYRFDGTTWSSPLQRVQRSVTLPFRELYPLIA